MYNVHVHGVRVILWTYNGGFVHTLYVHMKCIPLHVLPTSCLVVCPLLHYISTVPVTTPTPVYCSQMSTLWSTLSQPI